MYAYPCQKCNDLSDKIRKAKRSSSTYNSKPSTLELAYMVNLEYYLDIATECVHKIPGAGDANSKIAEMVNFLDERHWEVRGRSSDGFKCSMFMNDPAKQIVIVHRGTELTNLAQIMADIRLATETVTPEIVAKASWHTYQLLMNHALKLNIQSRKFERNGYSVTITGHSLGGWLAQLSTLLCKYPKYFPVGPRGAISFGNNTMLDMDQPYDLHCVTFDSPGAKAILTKLDENPAFLNGGPREIEVALKDLDITIYMANKNLISLCGNHMQNVKRIDVMKNSSFWSRWNPIASHSMEGIFNYFKNNPTE